MRHKRIVVPMFVPANLGRLVREMCFGIEGGAYIAEDHG